MITEFLFEPLQKVKVTAYGLGYRGRVQRCIADGDDILYDVEYADNNGDIRRGEFHDDELEPQP